MSKKPLNRFDVCAAFAKASDSNPASRLRKSSKGKPRLNVAHELFAKHLQELGLRFEREVRVLPTRKWRWDFVFWTVFGHTGKSFNSRWAVEIDGYHNGRHGAGWGADNEKQNTGVRNKWNPLRFSTNDVKSGAAKAWIQENLL